MRIAAIGSALLSLALSLSSVSLSDAQTAPLAVNANRVADHPDLTSSVRLKNAIPGWAIASRDAGAMTMDRKVGVTLVLARAPEVQAAFDQLVADQQNPNSPRYHQWLSAEQIGAQYGPTQHDVDAMSGWLQSQGLSITAIAPSRMFIDASGSASTIAKAFSTSFRMYTVRGKARYSAAVEPSLPSGLSAVVQTISGLSEIDLHSMSQVREMPAATRGQGASPQYTTAGGNHYMFPGDFATIFDINPVYSANIKGGGQKVAIIGRSQIAVSDITAFESVSGLPSNTPNIIVAATGNDPGIQKGDEGESDLDLQRVIGVAPAVTADFVISGTDQTTGQDGIYVAMQYEIQTLKDPVATLSYGACEAEAGISGVTLYSTLFNQAAAEGISVFISSGDSGAAGCDSAFTTAPTTQQLSINYICSNPYATCVGGTEFNDTASPTTYWNSTNASGTNESAIGYIPEGAWNESVVGDGTFQIAGSGGGVSTLTTKPSFQAGIGVPADGFRDTPDVSFPAASHDGYFGCEADLTFTGGGSGNCASGGGVIFSGTSAAAPGWAGVTALLNEKLGGNGQGSLNALIYRLAGLTTGNPFHDVTPTTSGINPCVLTTPSLCNNSTPGPTTLTGGLAGYAVTPGYDLVTGWGSPDVNSLLTAAAAQATLIPTQTTLTATPTTISTAQTVVFTAVVASTGAAATGTVQFSSNGVALGAPVTLVNGTATSPAESFTTIGAYNISAVYSGSSTDANSSAPSINLNVTAVGTTVSTAVLTATATTGAAATPIGFTVTVTGAGGTPTGTVQFKLNGANFGAAVSLASGAATLAPAGLPVGTNMIVAVYSGDNTFHAVTSNTVTVTVTAAVSTTTISPLTASTDPTGYVNITATVTGSSGVPTGNVTLYQAGTGGGSLGVFSLANGTATITLYGTAASPLPTGVFNFYFVYAGDAVYAGSQSGQDTVTITTGFTPTVTLTPASTTVTTTAGAATPATDTITVDSENGYNGNVALTCAAVFNGTSSITIVLPTCSASPTSVAIGFNGNSGTSTVSLTTVAPHAIARAANGAKPGLGRRDIVGGLGGVSLAGLLLFSIPAVRRRRSWSALASLLLLCAVAGLAGCGGGGSAPVTPPAQTGTPAGAYTVTVSGGGATTTFALTVQ